MVASIAIGCHCAFESCYVLCAVPDAPRGHSPQALRMAPVPLNTGELHQCDLILNTLLASAPLFQQLRQGDTGVVHASAHESVIAISMTWCLVGIPDLIQQPCHRFIIQVCSDVQSVVACCRLAIEWSLGRLMCNAASGHYCFVSSRNEDCAEGQTAVT